MKFSKHEIEKAYQELIAESVMLSDETEGAKLFAAIEKAMLNIEQNPTIKFTGNILGFTSMESSKQRFVTKNGCTKSCDCKGTISYHSATFDILKRAYDNTMKDTQRPYFQTTLASAEKKNVRVGQIVIR